MAELLIRNGNIIDGTGRKAYKADVLIQNGIISRIGTADIPDGIQVIDAEGLAVAPGFIDGHTHSELVLLQNRQHINAVVQGVTTEVFGQCGLGFAPASAQNRENLIKMYSGIFGSYHEELPKWDSFGSFMRLFDNSAVNVASAVTHGAIRACGTDFHNLPLKGSFLNKSKQALRCAMEEGAVGFSTGLSYYPSSYGDTQELIELCKIVKEYDGLYQVHYRVDENNPIDPVEESIEIARQTGVRMHMLHYKTGWPSSNGNVRKILSPFDEAFKEKLDITFEFYPFFVGAGFCLVFLPGWAQEGGYDNTLYNLSDRSLRERLIKDVSRRYDMIACPELGLKNVFSHLKYHREYIGRDFDSVAAERGQTIVEMLLDLLLEDELEIGYRASEPQEPQLREQLYNDMFELLARPDFAVGSDSIPLGEKPHPRSFGTFPKFLRLAREHAFPLETMVHKMTGMLAQRYRLYDRGVIKEGKAADITVFDKNTVTETATFENPRSLPKGIRYVIVNGKIALWDGAATGITSGKALKRMTD